MRMSDVSLCATAVPSAKSRIGRHKRRRVPLRCVDKADAKNMFFFGQNTFLKCEKMRGFPSLDELEQTQCLFEFDLNHAISAAYDERVLEWIRNKMNDLNPLSVNECFNEDKALHTHDHDHYRQYFLYVLMDTNVVICC